MKQNNLTVIMYHYVRDLKNSRYPSIKGLDKDLFIEQIEYLRKHYNFVTMEQVINVGQNGASLPSKAVLLTFDDGYAEHFNVVFPILKNRGIQGSFFAPIKAITESTILDVNKIHFILAASRNPQQIIEDLRTLIKQYEEKYYLKSFNTYYQALAKKDRFDCADVIFIKRLLQVELPLEVRKIITDALFQKIVGIDESIFSRELYMNVEQIKCMANAGMHIGSHGFDHFWLNSLTRDQQRFEVEKSVEFIRTIYGDKFNKWTICYPYGAYNNETLSLLKESGCSIGFTTEVNIAKVMHGENLTLPRLDTNDIPKDRSANVNNWYELA